MSGLIRSPILKLRMARITRILWRIRGIVRAHSNTPVQLPASEIGDQGHREMRDKVLYIAILILVAIAFFEGGYILGYLERDEIKAKLQQVNEWVIDHGGRIVALETLDRREKTGSGKPIPTK